ncbi:MAG: hypothetical protein HZA64_02325 [Rhodocyclales bacterium]|nr:hypothetical protein [Rhodocyclales bacterium]
MLRLSTMAESPDTIEREVWATPAEFRHGLAMAFPDAVREENCLFKVIDRRAAMEIALTELPPRVIALLAMPRMKVRISMTAGTPEQRQAMLARMDRAMQRGGG